MASGLTDRCVDLREVLLSRVPPLLWWGGGFGPASGGVRPAGVVGHATARGPEQAPCVHTACVGGRSPAFRGPWRPLYLLV